MENVLFQSYYSLSFQVSEKSLICEHSFLSDRCNLGNSGSIPVTKKKSDIHFPDLRSPVLPELRGREGMLTILCAQTLPKYLQFSKTKENTPIHVNQKAVSLC